LHLVIAGERVAEYLDLRGCDSSLLSRVRPIGFVPNERMHLAYQLAEFFILSKVCDSFGLPILEALACGCPAIVPGTCAAPEVAAGAAWFIDPYAEHEMTRAMQELDGSPTLRGQLRARGLERARAFSWPKVARRVLTVLEELP
jgi:glycosyltransferase involved in cell wall biosynthesis